MKASLFAYAIVGLAVALPAAAQGDAGHAGHHPAAVTATVAARADGEVRKVDKSAGTLTIKHGPIAALDQPPMTMVFQAKDPSILDRVKAGDKIQFTAERTDGGFAVTQIEIAR